MSPPRPAERRFSEYLEDMVAREDRGALAALRRGLGKGAGEAAEMYPYVVRFLLDDNRRSIQNAYYLVAALFARHQLPWRSEPGDRHSTNLGASFAWLKSGLASDSIEK